MKKTLITLILCLSTTMLTAGVVNDGIYRIVCAVNSKVVIEDAQSGKLYCGNKGSDTSFEQLWRITGISGDSYSMQNLLTQRYIQADGSSQFYTGKSSAGIFITQNAAVSSFLNIYVNNGYKYWNYQGGTGLLVTWSACTGDSDAQNNRSAWKLVSVNVDQDLLALAQKEFQETQGIIDNAATYAANVNTFFTDDSAEELVADYAAMDESSLRAAMDGKLPPAIIDYAVRLAADKWASKWEKMFRFGTYKAYGDPDYWSGAMANGVHGYLNNPTGIRVDNGQLLYIFVGDNIPSSATLEIETLAGTGSVKGTRTKLKKGLNIISSGKDDQAVFVRYTAGTRLNNNLTLADFPDLRINIQGGTVNGYWDITRHTNDDWKEMLADKNLFSGFAIQVKGRHVLWNMNSKLVRKYVPDHIEESISVWDSIQIWECRQMGLEEAVPAKHDFVLNCVSVTGDNYMYASGSHTAYNESTLSSILYYTNYRDGAGGAYWGPAHETGHNNQYLITFPGGTEVSNNMFSNIVVYSGGKGTSRGVGVRDGVCKDFGKSWFDRDIWQQTRMYYQLYLYFYELGKDKDYIPNLFKALRADPMVSHNASTVSGQDSWLKFALKCCQIANADLSEFFESYGFFVPVSNRLVEDYSNSYVTMTERTAQQFREKMQAYEKKLGNLVFVEDRIYAAFGREPWGSTDKLRIDYSNEWPLGKMGDVGQYLNYEDETLVPSGYTYTRKGLKMTINHAEGKGAVGFKVYDAEGTLVAISNTYTFNLPQTMDGQKIKVVAAAPVGNNDAEILSSALAGTEAEQLEALKSSLSTAKSYLAMTDSTNAVVGWFVASAIEPLQAVYDQAKAAMDNADQSEHTYGGWSIVVDDAVSDLLNDNNAKIALRPNNCYALYLYTYSNYCAANLSGGLKGNMLDPAENLSKQWVFVPGAAENTYYIQNFESGLFISYIASGKRVTAEADDTKNALLFSLVESGIGRFALYCKSQNLYMGYASNKDIVGKTSETDALWILKLVSDNYSDALLERAEKDLKEAWRILAEVLDPETDCICVAGYVVPLTETFEEDILTLYGFVREVEEAHYLSNIEVLEKLLPQLEAAIAAVKDAYLIKQTMPQMTYITTNGDGTAYCYAIQNLKTRMYCYLDDGTGRYAGNICTGELDENDHRFWFYFMPLGDDSECFIYNLATIFPAAINSSYIDISGKKDSTPFTLTLNEDETGFIIANGDNYWATQTSGQMYAQIRKTPSEWRFVPVGTYQFTGIHSPFEDNKEGYLFDLTGRRIETPSSGLYIRNGKKVYIK